MPAKTVVFTNTRKWDGKDFRWVTSGEYIQMSGRAGRRGKDDRGIVIQMLDEKMEPDVCKGILYGAPDPLNSSYRISYNMLLNLMRVEDVDPEYLLRASFHQFQREQDAPGLIAEAEALENEAGNITFESSEKETLVAEYYQMDEQLLVNRRKIAQFIRNPEYILKFLQSKGRFVDISIDNDYFGWGVTVSCKKKQGTGACGDAGHAASQSLVAQYSLEVLLNCVDRHFDQVDGKGKEEDAENARLLWRGSSKNCRPCTLQDDRKIVSMRVFTVTLESIERISAVKVVIPPDVTTPEARTKVALLLLEAKKRFEGNIPLLDPVRDMGITDVSFHKLIERAEKLEERLTGHQLSLVDTKDRIDLVQSFQRKSNKLEEAKNLRDKARSCQSLAMKDDLKRMKRVLKRLGHFDGNGVIQTKGRTACEINTAAELVVVELMFTGVFNDLSVEQWYVLLS
jgi:ATP-dependent RNA helicase DOB1